MKAQFPQIRCIDDVRPHVEGRDDIRIMPREHGFTVNYLVSMPDTWGEPGTETHWMRRECRGLLFDHQGKIISRPYHKFFNFGEKSFTTADCVDLSQPHVILEKLDGSMIRAFFDAQGRIRWGTKMGETAIAQAAGEFAARNASLMAFVGDQLTTGFTPLFEWCSRSQRIVVDYPQDRLVLTALRDMITGEYVSFEQMRMRKPLSVEMVQSVEGYQSLDHVVREARKLSGEEGWIIRFDSGEMIKLKADEYVRHHRALDGLRWEKDVLAMILAGEADDVRSIVAPEVRAQLDEFERVVGAGVLARARALESAVEAAQHMDRKTFAITVAAQWPHPEERGILFKLLEGQQAASLVIEMLKKRVGSQSDVDSVRWVWGDFRWNARALGDLDT